MARVGLCTVVIRVCCVGAKPTGADHATGHRCIALSLTHCINNNTVIVLPSINPFISAQNVSCIAFRTRRSITLVCQVPLQLPILTVGRSSVSSTEQQFSCAELKLEFGLWGERGLLANRLSLWYVVVMFFVASRCFVSYRPTGLHRVASKRPRWQQDLLLVLSGM